MAFNGHGRSCQTLRESIIGQWIVRYFPVHLEQEARFRSDTSYIFGYHPHGVLGFGVWANFVFDGLKFARENLALGQVHVATLGLNFYLPFWRDGLLALGFVSASFESLEGVLLTKKPRKSVLIVIGGAQEALDAHEDTYDLTLRRRRGFIRLALSTGSSLVPVFCFGETNTYWQVRELGLGIKTFLKSYTNIRRCAYEYVNNMNI